MKTLEDCRQLARDKRIPDGVMDIWERAVSATPAEKFAGLREIFAIVSQCESVVMQEAMLREAAGLFLVNADAVLTDYRSWLRNNAGRGRRAQHT